MTRFRISAQAHFDLDEAEPLPDLNGYADSVQVSVRYPAANAPAWVPRPPEGWDASIVAAVVTR